MLVLFVLFWFSFDDWLAGACGAAALGQVPVQLWVVCLLAAGWVSELLGYALKFSLTFRKGGAE